MPLPGEHAVLGRMGATCTGHPPLPISMPTPCCMRMSHSWRAYMIKHQAIQLGIAKLGGICNSWRHYSFLASAQSWSKYCPQFDKKWYMTKNKQPEPGVNQVCCRRQAEGRSQLHAVKVATISCRKRTADTLKSFFNVFTHSCAETASTKYRHS